MALHNFPAYPLVYDPIAREICVDLGFGNDMGYGGRPIRASFALSSLSLVGASRALTSADNSHTLECTADSIVLTVPAGLPSGFACKVIPQNAVTLAPSGGVQLNGASNVAARFASDGTMFSIYQTGTDAYLVDGRRQAPTFLLADLSTHTASGVTTVNGSPVVIDIGAANGAVAVDVAAVDFSSGNETYLVAIQACNASDFGSGVVSVGSVSVNAVGRFVIGFSTVVGSAPSTTTYRYLRALLTLAGTTPSISLVAYIG